MAKSWILLGLEGLDENYRYVTGDDDDDDEDDDDFDSMWKKQ